MPLKLQDTSPGRRDQNESLDLMAGTDDSILIRAGETFDGVAQKCRIAVLVVNEPAVIGNLIADDDDSTDVIAGGLTKGYKNMDLQTLSVGVYIPAGKYQKGRGWKSVTVTSGSVKAYYKYIPQN